ncbi:MAG: hypothetical protein KIT43_10195 [Bauldia sp.]|nr:hypothetical protein [Bauldia sp.]
MAIPFRPLVAARPRVLPATGNAFGQFAQGLYSGFGAGQARAREDELPALTMEASEVFGSAALGSLMEPPDPSGSHRSWTPDERALLERMLRNPGTREWAQQILAVGPRSGTAIDQSF